MQCILTDLENVPSKPSAAWVIIFGSGKFLVSTYPFLSRMAKMLTNMLYQAVRGQLILGWVIFPGYVTLPSHGNFTQTDVVYPAWVWLPSLAMVTQAG